MSSTAGNRSHIAGVFFSFILCLAMIPTFTYAAAGNIDVNGIVPGPPPSTAPSIDVPANDTVFHETPIKVKGGCTAGLIVKVFRNSLFAGAAQCEADGQYTMMVDLVELDNTLVARQYDTLNQASPDSNVVVVRYEPPVAPTPSPQTPGAPTQEPKASEPLVIYYNYTVQGVGVGDAFSFDLTFNGGEPPYAISIDWGDGEVSVFSRQDTATFAVDHTYKNPGVYTVKVRISDKNGKEAYLQFVIIAKGKPSLKSTISEILTTTDPSTLVWVATSAGAVMGVAGFAVGAFGPRLLTKVIRIFKKPNT